MTQLEQFKDMLKDTDSEIKLMGGNYGDNVSVVFKVLGGLAGSGPALVEAFFNKKTGEFIAVHWCD